MVRPWPDWPDQSLRAWKRGKEKIKIDQRNEKGGKALHRIKPGSTDAKDDA